MFRSERPIPVAEQNGNVSRESVRGDQIRTAVLIEISHRNPIGEVSSNQLTRQPEGAAPTTEKHGEFVGGIRHGKAETSFSVEASRANRPGKASGREPHRHAKRPISEPQ